MAARLSSPALRTLLFDLSSELASYNSAELPDGATAYDNQTDTLFRLDKNAGATSDALIGSGLFVKPDDQTPARWFADAVSGSSPYYSGTYAISAPTIAMTGNQWAYLGSTASSFGVNAGNPSAFTLNETTGEVTYHGPARLALVTAQATVRNGAAANTIEIHACLSRSDDVVAGSTTDYSAKGEQEIFTANVNQEITTQRILLLNPGTTLRLAFRNVTNEDDLTVTFYQLTVVPI